MIKMALPITVCFCFVTLGLILGSGMAPGLSLWINSMTQQGIGNSICQDGANRCDRQALGIANALIWASNLDESDRFAALMCQFWSFKSVSLIGIFLAELGWIGLLIADIGHQIGFGSGFPVSLIVCGILLNNGTGFAGFAKFEFFQFFPSSVNLVNTIIGAGVSSSAFVAIFVNSVMNSTTMHWHGVLAFELSSHAFSGILLFIFVPRASEPEIHNVDSHPSEINVQAEEVKCATVSKVIWQDFGRHVFFVVLIAIAPGWAIFYSNGIIVYARFLFHSAARGQELASALTAYGAVAFMIIMPLAVWTLPFRMILLTFIVLTVGVGHLISLPVIRAQHFVAMVCGITWSMLGLTIMNHLFTYFSFQTFPMAALFLHSAVQFVMYILIPLQMRFVNSHQSTLGDTYSMLTKPSVIAWTLYIAILSLKPDPKHPVIIQELEIKICNVFACKKFEEIAAILKLPKEVIIHMCTRQALNSDLISKCVRRLDVGALRMHFQKNVQSEITKWFFDENVFWRRSQRTADYQSTWDVMSHTNLHHAHNSNIDMMDQKLKIKLKEELAEDRSKLIYDNGGREIIRSTEIVVLRLGVEIHGEIFFLLEVNSHDIHNVPKWKYRLPATKKNKKETHMDAACRLLNQLGMDTQHVVFDARVLDQQSGLIQSSTYPTLRTQYVKHVLFGVVKFVSTSRSLLPKNQSFAKKTNPGKSYDWLTENELQHLAPDFSMPDLSFSTKQQKTCTKKNIILYQSYPLMAKITRTLRKHDLIGFNEKLLQNDENRILTAIISMSHWTGRALPKYAALFKKMMQQHMLRHEASGCTNILIEIMILEIIGKQRSLASAL